MRLAGRQVSRAAAVKRVPLWSLNAGRCAVTLSSTEEFECARDGAAGRHLPKVGIGGFNRGCFVRPNRCRSLRDVYDIGETLGSGAYGSVCYATHIETKEPVAVKSIAKSPDLDTESMQLEVEFMRVSDHPNIIRLYETFEDDAYFYFVMEYCSGGDLWKHVRTQHEIGVGLSEQELATMMQQMLRAVSYCHAHSIVHRDLKPDNFIFPSPDPDVPLRLADFGVSGVISQKIERFLTRTIGTDGYMAPEVLCSRPYAASADMFSMGAVMHAIVTGTPPRWDTEKQVYNFPGKIRWRMLSKGASSLLSRLLEVDPSIRPTASEALNDPWIKEHACTDCLELNQNQIDRMWLFGERSKMQRLLMESTVAFADRPAVRSPEIRALKDMFLAADTDGDGEVDVENMAVYLQKCNAAHHCEETARTLVQALDDSHDGKISYSEWLAAAAPPEWFSNRRCTRRAFDALDADGDGCISTDDLQQTLPGVFEPGEIETEMERLKMIGRLPLTFEDFNTILQFAPTEVSVSE